MTSKSKPPKNFDKVVEYAEVIAIVVDFHKKHIEDLLIIKKLDDEIAILVNSRAALLKKYRGVRAPIVQHDSTQAKITYDLVGGFIDSLLSDVLVEKNMSKEEYDKLIATYDKGFI